MCALKVKRICVLATDSFAKSGKYTDSFAFLGKSYRFFEEIRRENTRACRRKLEQSRRIYEPEMDTKSEQKYSDKARKTGK